MDDTEKTFRVARDRRSPFAVLAWLAVVGYGVGLGVSCSGPVQTQSGDQVICCFNVKYQLSDGKTLTREGCNEERPVCSNGGTTKDECEPYECDVGMGVFPAFDAPPPGLASGTLECKATNNSYVKEQDACDPGSGDTGSDEMDYPGQYRATFTKATSGSMNLTVNGVTKSPNYTMEVLFQIHSCTAASCKIEIDAVQLDTVGSYTFGTRTVSASNLSLKQREIATVTKSTGAFSIPASGFGANIYWRQKNGSLPTEFWSRSVSNNAALSGWVNSWSAPTTLKFDGVFSGTVGSNSATIDLNEVVGSVAPF